jgi:hypothetical protein
MYIPDNGYADANVIIGWWTTNSTTHVTTKYYAAVVHEATTAGWIELNMQEPAYPDGGAADVNSLQFRDNNGQTGTVIGWGANKYYGIKEVCY